MRFKLMISRKEDLIVQDDLEIIHSIGSDLKDSIDDLIYHIKTMKEDIETIKTKEE